ncbi:hypothetical protein [Nocardiopsis halotolerans]|uniref:hypothetical protein n=1 Tax=Nocardiopsis halotolerans TaxID=124252 RepID=UPI00034D4846|nr:hypothetical protein [Nocardiopsis halotolerans]
MPTRADVPALDTTLGGLRERIEEVRARDDAGVVEDAPRAPGSGTALHHRAPRS